MKLGVLFATLMLLASPSWASDKPLILITSFDGFMGATINNSNKVSKVLAGLIGDRFEVAECLVPTIYDVAFERATDCLKSLPRKPDIILSLGEGSCGAVKLETLTLNIDDSWANDNANNVRRDHVIIPNEAPSKNFYFFNEQTPSIVKDINGMELSEDMGTFVCNNIGFHMTTYLENYSAPRIPYAFIHVPSHTCNENSHKKNGLGVSVSAQAISKLLLTLKI